MTYRSTTLRRVLISVIVTPLMLAACGKGVAPVAREAGRPIAHEAGEPLARGAGEGGREIAGQSVNRAAVQAEAESMAAPYSHRAVDAACKIKSLYSLATAEELDDQVIEAAGLAGVPYADVRGLLNDLREAESSGEQLRIYAAALVCASVSQ